MKLLGFDDLIARLRAVVGALPDPRPGDNTRYSMADIALAAFSGPDVEAALQAARKDRDWQTRQAAEDLLQDE